MRTIRVSDEVDDLVEKIRALGAPFSLITSKTGIIEYALLLCLGKGERPITVDQINELITAYRSGMLDKLAESLPATPVEDRRSPGRPRKDAPVVAAVIDNVSGTAICSVLGGTVANGSCMYKKREITPTGKAVEFEVGIPLDRLSQLDIDGQYEPTREIWEAAKAKQEETA